MIGVPSKEPNPNSKIEVKKKSLTALSGSKNIKTLPKSVPIIAPHRIPKTINLRSRLAIIIGFLN